MHRIMVTGTALAGAVIIAATASPASAQLACALAQGSIPIASARINTTQGDQETILTFVSLPENRDSRGGVLRVHIRGDYGSSNEGIDVVLEGETAVRLFGVGLADDVRAACTDDITPAGGRGELIAFYLVPEAALTAILADGTLTVVLSNGPAPDAPELDTSYVTARPGDFNEFELAFR